MPPQAFWDEDFAAIRRTGMRIVRTFSYWNWIEPAPGKYELDDFDRFFELAHKHGLLVWFDTTLATHGAAPEWMMRRHPDMRVVSSEGQVALGRAGNAAPQGKQWHCYDHPKWQEHGEALLRTIVGRYKDAPNLLMWSVWDGVAPVSRHYGFGDGCYCENSIAAFRDWLRQRFTLDQLNERLHRRYRDWADVEPARTNHAIVEMMLWREFLYANMTSKLKWQVDVVRRIDDKHEIRGHGARYPRVWDEMSAAEVDSWGFSSPSNNFLTGDDPYRLGHTFFIADWSRSIGCGGRWWYEEIYAGMNPGSVNYRKQSTPQEISINMWLALARGAAGALLWQYRPEYLSFEAPGLSLVTSAGEPLPRLTAVEQTIKEMHLLEGQLPLAIPNVEVAVVYHDKSDMLHQLGRPECAYFSLVRDLYCALWQHNVPVDVISPQMDWSRYKVVYLPSTVVVDEPLNAKITATLQDPCGPYLIADGLLGTNAPNGRFSYDPPEGLSSLLGVRVLDYTRLTDNDIRDGANKLRLANDSFDMTGACNYVGLTPSGETRPIAWYGEEVVGIETVQRRFTWITFSLTAALGSVACDKAVIPLLKSFGIDMPVRTEGDRIIVQRARSRQGGWLLFLFNLERKAAETRVTPAWEFSEADDLLEERPLAVKEGHFATRVPAGGVKVLHVT